MKNTTNHKRSLLSALRCDQSGATMIEFAFVAPIMFLMILATIEFALMFHKRASIEEATRTAARKAITNIVPDGQNRGNYLLAQLQDSLEALGVEDTAYNVESRTYANFNAVGQNVGNNSGNGDAVSFGAPGELVRYTVEFEYEFITPLSFILNGMSSNLVLQSTVFTKNEEL